MRNKIIKTNLLAGASGTRAFRSHFLLLGAMISVAGCAETPAAANGASAPAAVGESNGAEIELTDAQSEPILGDYTLGMGIVMKLSREAGALFMQMVGPGRPPQKHELGATSATEFFMRDGKAANARLTFVKDANGKVTDVILHQKNAPDQKFPRAQ